ncbi:hypothetical protein RCH14_003474 [Massilia sp. MP_M2]|uniref:hypothetical protein n=1 Tax=Massilia sp. MP_M2 TaxID=3071713 RepID=UPI00319DF14D
MFRILLMLVVVSALAGCAATAGTFFNRPVVEDDVGQVVRTVSLSADRRTVIVAAPEHPQPRFCAEPPPDTAMGIKASIDTAFTVPGKSVTLKDDFGTAVTVLASRNAPLDAFRTGMFALCQFYLNGAIKADKVEPLFRGLLKTFETTQNFVNAAVSATKPLPGKPADAAGGAASAGASAESGTGSGAGAATATAKGTSATVAKPDAPPVATSGPATTPPPPAKG